MYDWLEYLVRQSYTFGALGIAEGVLFLWKEHFETNPLYEQVEQQGWFPTANHKLPIAEKFSKLQISSSECHVWTTTGLHSPVTCEINKRATVCISKALALEEGKEVGKNHLVHKNCLAACNEIADLIDTQNSLVDEYIRTSPPT